MARPRLFIDGLSHHVTHRGNNRCDVFRDRADREMFLSYLRASSVKYRVTVHGFVLMTTHIHAQVTASDPDGLPRMMQSLGRRYVRYFNDRYHRTGTLWEGRYDASLILDERYWYRCLRYIERNPVRAGIVAVPGDYEWSSYRANALGTNDPLLTPHPLYVALGTDAQTRATAWAAVCQEAPSEGEVMEIRSVTYRGGFLGTAVPAILAAAPRKRGRSGDPPSQAAIDVCLRTGTATNGDPEQAL
jgi:putative transposase